MSRRVIRLSIISSDYYTEIFVISFHYFSEFGIIERMKTEFF